MTGATAGAHRTRHPAASAGLHAMGNMLLGVSLGLLLYYGVTSIEADVDQARLRIGEAEYITSRSPDGLVSDGSGPALDFDSWEDLDLAFWRGLDEGDVFGRMSIDAIGVDQVVLKGISRSTLKKGPGWLPDTGVPGPSGNTGIAGHRTTYGAPFGKLDALKAGDTIDVYSPYRRYRYEVERVFIVSPDRTDVMDLTDEPSLTLSACHPRYSARQRIIVRARLVEAKLLESAQRIRSPE